MTTKTKLLYTVLVCLLLAQPARAEPIAATRAALANSLQRGQFRSFDGVTIATAMMAKGTEDHAVVIVPGLGEGTYKYYPLMWEFFQQGVAAYAFDPRGQGDSDKNSTVLQLAHVDSMEEYVKDLGGFTNLVKLGTEHKQYLLLAHSTGALTASLFLLRNPKAYDKAAFTAPLYGLQTGSLPEWLVLGLMKMLCFVDTCESFAPGSGLFDPAADLFEKNDLTHNKERFLDWRRTQVKNPQYIVGGPSRGWVKSVIEGYNKVKKQAAQLQIPLLILRAGKDNYVTNPPQKAVCDRAANCRLVTYDDSFHEILQELPEVRDDALAQIRRHFGL